MRMWLLGAACVGLVAVPAGVVVGVASASGSRHSVAGPQRPATVVLPSVAPSPSPLPSPSPSPKPTIAKPTGVVRVFTPIAEHQTVGVGQVVDLRFDKALSPAEQRTVEQHLVISTKPAGVLGAWHWISDHEVHFRPKDPWKPGTTINVVADLRDVRFAGGQQGGHLTWTVDVGRSRHAVADLRTDQMIVTDIAVDGTKTKRTVPFSGGTLARPTRDGTFIALSAEAHVVMDSDTVGIPAGSKDSYRIPVDDAVRLTDSGTYVHGAPWSVASQGHTNVSHGCLNVSPSDARWFRTTTLLGDLVTVNGSTATYVPTDHGSADWSPRWATILKDSRTGPLHTS